MCPYIYGIMLGGGEKVEKRCRAACSGEKQENGLGI